MEEKKNSEITKNPQNASFANVNASSSAQPQTPQSASSENFAGVTQAPQTVPGYTPAAGMYQPAPKRSYTAAESGFAWLCFVLGYLFIRVFMGGFRPLGEFLFVILLYALTFVVVKLEKARFNAPAVISLLSGLALAFSTVVSGNGGGSLLRVRLFACGIYIFCIYRFRQQTRKRFYEFASYRFF